MLNIPDEVKALFKADSVFKNFHVHFPNGENADLNNDDIVAESVSFTESICSKEVFQFGLSERSQIEFECVGVQNIYGMTIECAIEIDVESLGAQWISDNAPTGTEAFLEPQVCTYDSRNMYRVPYGRFIVESCPRSQGAMKHRKVTAYSVDGYANAANITSPVLTAKELYPIDPQALSDGKIKQNAFLLLAGETQNIDGLTLTETTLAFANDTDGGSNDFQWEYNGTTYAMQVDATGATYKCCNTGDFNSLYRFTYEMNEYALEDMNNALLVVGGFGGDVVAAREFLTPWFYPVFAPSYYIGGHAYNADGKIAVPSDTGYFYGFYSDQWSESAILYPSNITINVYAVGGASLYSKTTGTIVDSATLKRYEQTDASRNAFVIGISTTGTEDGKQTFYGGLNVYDLARGLAEITGQFFTGGRTGDAKNITISDSDPIAVAPADYSEMWWDEYDVAPVGTIRLKYYDFQNAVDQETEISIGSGASIYDMTNNYYLSNMFLTIDDIGSSTVGDYVANLLKTYFVPELGNIYFTPVTLDAIGLPYLEAGDFLEIDDADGGTVGTYILSRTISGIQVLTDSIESKGGEVMGDGS